MNREQAYQAEVDKMYENVEAEIAGKSHDELKEMSLNARIERQRLRSIAEASGALEDFDADGLAMLRADLLTRAAEDTRPLGSPAEEFALAALRGIVNPNQW